MTASENGRQARTCRSSSPGRLFLAWLPNIWCWERKRAFPNIKRF
jgi:hypothetical protein